MVPSLYTREIVFYILYSLVYRLYYSMIYLQDIIPVIKQQFNYTNIYKMYSEYL